MSKRKRLLNQFPFLKFSTNDKFSFNPNVTKGDLPSPVIKIAVIDYNESKFEHTVITNLEDCFKYKTENTNTWINVDGISKQCVEELCNAFDVHWLLQEDILSINQRAKVDEVNQTVFCLLKMLYYNKEKKQIEYEQVSIVMGNNFILSFQEEAERDLFAGIREKLKFANHKIRISSIDFLLYSLIDAIVDNYFEVLDKFLNEIEKLEDEVSEKGTNATLSTINHLRKEAMILKRTVQPVREMLQTLVKSENELLTLNSEKYFKDVLDHSTQAIDAIDNYRELIFGLNELYMSNMNLQMNQIMKVLAIVTTLLAPLTVITGIYGMNFKYMPELSHTYGYFMVIGLMLTLFIVMLFAFKRRGWL
jgi:magnesium transporter